MRFGYVTSVSKTEEALLSSCSPSLIQHIWNYYDKLYCHGVIQLKEHWRSWKYFLTMFVTLLAYMEIQRQSRGGSGDQIKKY